MLPIAVPVSDSLPPQTLLRHGLLPTIISTMLTIMASPEGEEEEEEGDDSAQESQSPITLAGQVVYSPFPPSLSQLVYPK